MSSAPQTTSSTGRSVRTTDIALPPSVVSVSQDREWCVVDVGGQWKKIRFHDYDEIYKVPGLYEALFHDVLKCTSPTTIREMLYECLDSSGVAPCELQVLDLGAGNGMVGEELAGLGVRGVVGVDIIPAAAEAVMRDRGDFYDDYFVLDMTKLSTAERSRLSAFDFNCLTCVAALGFGDIPPAAFSNAYNLIERGGWVAFNIKNDFLGSGSRSGFAVLIQRMIDSELIEFVSRREYRHRLATCGKPLMYTAFVGIKKRDIPAGWGV